MQWKLNATAHFNGGKQMLEVEQKEFVMHSPEVQSEDLRYLDVCSFYP